MSYNLRDMKLAWIPEHPAGSMYRAKVPSRRGKLGELEDLLTADANYALQFDTKAECEAWIKANPQPPFVAQEHGFYSRLETEEADRGHP